MTAPTFWTVPDFLMGEFPHLKKEIEEEYLSAVNAAANPYPHLFLEEFLLPILAGSMSVEEKDRRRAGQILDELLRSPDEDLASAALTSVLEMIAGSEKLRDASRSFLGPVALDWLDRLTRQASAVSGSPRAPHPSSRCGRPASRRFCRPRRG